jgi:rare lipoprotein A (peptidoglycan hydrolase)
MMLAHPWQSIADYRGRADLGLPDKKRQANLRAMIRRPFVIALVILVSVAFSFDPTSGFGPKRYHDGETEKGEASWYGPNFQGKLTADGETFDQNQMTAAHRYLPFNTIVKVTNLSNGKSVELRINDRGPYEDDRIIDVSSAAADILEMKGPGVVEVELEVIQLGSPGRRNNG